MAEAILNRLGAGRFLSYSAGSHPKGEVHPMALEILRERGHDTSRLRSKSWNEFSLPDSPKLDFVFTVCDNAAGETCPIWPGRPMTAHWGEEDPAAFAGSKDQQRWTFRSVYRALERRIDLFTNLRIDALDRMSLQSRLEEIGKTETSSGEGIC